MDRRRFVTSVVAGGLAVPTVIADGKQDGDLDRAHEHDHDHEHPPISGEQATATVSFGSWPYGVDRMNLPPGPPPNVHQVIPYVTTIKVGGTVNFIVAGFHQIVVYGPGTRPEDINTSLLIPFPGAPPPPPALPPLIDDPNNRVYRGTTVLPPLFDRTEAVQFTRRGLHLVICSLLPHFEDRMWGWVRVVR